MMFIPLVKKKASVRFLSGNPQITFDELNIPDAAKQESPAVSDNQKPRDKLAAGFRRQADELDRQMMKDIHSYKPMGQMSEVAQALHLEPKKGVVVSTPIGPVVFAKARTPDKKTVESWEQLHKKSDELRSKALQYSFSIVPKPHITTGNYRVVEQGKRLHELGLLTPAEIRELEKLEKFWQDHPELDRQKDVGMWNENLELVPWRSSIPEKRQQPEQKDPAKGDRFIEKNGNVFEFIEPRIYGTGLKTYVAKNLKTGCRVELYPEQLKAMRPAAAAVPEIKETPVQARKGAVCLGGLKITSKDVKPGDLVKYRGSYYKVKRVNPKSVTIMGWMGMPDRTYLADYSHISDVKSPKKNPRDVIGDPPNPIMKMQLLKLWKEVLGSEDVGDFSTFMKEASDLTYDEAKRKLLKTYGTPERIRIKSARDMEEAFHAQMCDAAEIQCDKGDAEACRTACEDCGIEEVCPPKEPEKRPAASWRRFPDHKSETRAVKEALKKAGIEAEVKHGRGTAWGWLEINIGDPGLRDGLKQGPFGSQYSEEELALHDRVLKIAKEVTGRHGDYDGEILVLAQGWRHRQKPVVKPAPIEPVATESEPVLAAKPVLPLRNLAQKLADMTGMPVAVAIRKPARKTPKAHGKDARPKPKAVVRKMKIPRNGIVRLTEQDMRGTIMLEW